MARGPRVFVPPSWSAVSAGVGTPRLSSSTASLSAVRMGTLFVVCFFFLVVLGLVGWCCCCCCRLSVCVCVGGGGDWGGWGGGVCVFIYFSAMGQLQLASGWFG